MNTEIVVIVGAGLLIGWMCADKLQDKPVFKQVGTTLVSL
jgi:hypothetical protein